MSTDKHKISLLEGYVDAKGPHQDVEFGKRLSVGDLMALDTDPQAKNPTQYNDLVLRKMITKFGKLKMPVPLNVLLGLNSVDREDLQAGADRFLELSRAERTAEYTEDNIVSLRFGFDIDSTIYQAIQFGKLTTGRDEVEADSMGLQGIARECFMIGRQIEKIQTADGQATVEGTLDLAHFRSLDAEDFNLLRIGAQMWRLSFRFARKKLPE